jgi:hypothetical protein
LVSQLIRGRKAEAVELLGDNVLILIRLDERTSELARGLAESSSLDSDSIFPTVEVEATATRTRMMYAEEQRPTTARHLLTPGVLAGMLDDAVHFIAPCRRRRLPERPIQQHVSVGRGEYNDLVLRHPTVSSYHAWLECDEDGAFYLADAGSRNATYLNDTRLDGRLTRLHEGDAIRFGSVQALACHPATLWESLR